MSRSHAPTPPQGMHGTLESLESRFTTVEDADGVFAICVDATDPTHPNGSITLMSGDDEYYGQISPPFDGNLLREFDRALTEAKSALPGVCTRKGGPKHPFWHIRSRNARDLPLKFDIPKTRPGAHPGCIANTENFAIVVGIEGNDLDHPLFGIYRRADATNEIERIYLASIHWFEAIENAVHRATEALPSPRPRGP